MTLDFKSGFAEKLTQFTNQKIALGFEYASPMRYLLRFDAMCRERYPTEHQLTREICMAWATKSQTEKNNSFRNRISQYASLRVSSDGLVNRHTSSQWIW